MAVEQIHTYCAMCTSRCGVIATVENGVFTKVVPDPMHPNGCICVKGTAAPEMVYSPDRLQYPMHRTRPKGDPDPGWVRITWDEALAEVASRLAEIREKSGPEAVVFGCATAAGTSAVDFFPWVQRLANSFGSPNIMFADHICSWNKNAAAQHTFGVSQPAPDYDQAGCVLQWGVNPQASKPTDAMRISQAKRRGAKIIVIDPRKTDLAQKADVWLQVRPGSDGILALAMIHVLLEEGLYDERFVQEWTNGPFLVRNDTQQLLTARDLDGVGRPDHYFGWDSRGGLPVAYHPDAGYEGENVKPALTGEYPVQLADGSTIGCRPVFAVLRASAAEYAPERSEPVTWVPAEEVRRATRLFATAQPSCYFTWVGLEQHTSATQINRAVCIFYALTGQFDRQGSNVLFAGTPTNSMAGRNLLPKDQAARRLGIAEHPIGPPGTAGWVTASDVYRAILEGNPYPVRALVTFGTDVLMGNGEPLRGKAALEALEFSVHIDLFANPSAAFADILLPAASCWERSGLRPSLGSGEDTAAWAQFREPVIPARHEARAEVDVICDLATRLGLQTHYFDGSVEAAMAHELAPSGVTLEELREHPMGVRVATRTRYQKYAEVDERTGRHRGFATPTRKVELYATGLAAAGHAPLPGLEVSAGSSFGPAEAPADYPLALTFFRLVQFRDVQDRNIPRLRRQVPDPFLEIHPATANMLGIQDNEWVIVETQTGRIRLKAKLTDAVHPRGVATAHGWWQKCQELGLVGFDPFGPESANANLLVSNESVDPISGSVPHRSLMCRVRKADLRSLAAE